MNARAWIGFAVLTLAGCGRSFDIKTPRRFVELDEDYSDYDYRATTADGVVVGVREIDIDSDKGGSLDFWVEAIEQRMRQVGGYALLEKKAARGGGGLRGKQLRFGRDEGERPYRFWVTVFLDGDTLYVIEAGGQEEVFHRAERDVEAMIKSLTP
jgi:hypothetical protein